MCIRDSPPPPSDARWSARLACGLNHAPADRARPRARFGRRALGQPPDSKRASQQQPRATAYYR
eukprot:4737810-Alexandrium_andersonii.AAC.1